MNLYDCQIYFGQSTDAEARIYAEFAWPTSVDGTAGGVEADALSVSGLVHGPMCSCAHTLTSRVPFRVVARSGADRQTLLAEAIIPDPCFWTPELPQLYDVVLKLETRDQVLATVTRQLGIRRLGACGQDLVFDGKRWVMRAVNQQHAQKAGSSIDQQLAACRDARVAILWRAPSDEVCRRASELGVLLAADLPTFSDALGELHRLSRYAAVALAVLPDDVRDDRIADACPKNLLLGQYLPATEGSAPARWANVLLVDAAGVDLCAAVAAHFDLPVLAYRPMATATTVEAARAACDSLQRDLASHGDFAGYIV